MAYYIDGVRITLHDAMQIRRYFLSEDEDFFEFPHRHSSPVRERSVSPCYRKPRTPVSFTERYNDFKRYKEIADSNAIELIREEEEAKLKAEKKKAKKQRQKEKKKQASNSNLKNNVKNAENICADLKNTSISSESVESEELDFTAAFVSKAIKKAKNPVEPKIERKINEEKSTKKSIKDIDSIIKMGLEYENKNNLKEAIQYYSEVLDLAPKRIDILLKRSLIYYKVAKFDKSIRDAKKVLQLSSNNVEAYYRIGEGHLALNNLMEAEEAFSNLINLNSHTEIAIKRLISIRVKQLVDMGFNPNDSFTALMKSKNRTLDEALEYLSNMEKVENVSEEVYYSDEEESEEDEDDEDSDDNQEEASGISVPITKPAFLPMPKPAVFHPPPTVQVPTKPAVTVGKNHPILKDSSNPFGCCSLFIGSLKKDITYMEVHDVFIKFGDIASIKLITEPTCYAFVNYQDSGSAGCAMEALQGSRWLLSTEPLVVKFPLKAVSQAMPSREKVSDLSKKCVPIETDAEKRMRPKPKTEECYFWRTTGCTYGDTCFNLHIPEHKGIALKDFHPFIARLGKRAAKAT